MNFYIAFIITILLQTVLSLPKTEPKIIPAKIDSRKNINDVKIGTVQKPPEKPSSDSKNRELTNRGYFHVDNSEESSSETHELIPVPDNLKGVDLICVVKVLSELVSCLKTTQLSAKGPTEAITAEDLLVQNGQIMACIMAAAAGLSQCISLTEMGPHSQEYEYDSSEEMTHGAKWRIN
ncbi:uncharacterized protein LOC115455378 isoform X2 [Manduca sexta]|uniref:uncharacterized protein LOC115455378 isoform X2 n=1 Tax=Manduca sexta TaxID=7130 RepID=UPI00188F8E56|nr:uncharacterized protein LOC115455378 isoform X2 [Manduca sexta]